MKQILITGDRSGSGKTSITLALAALLSKKEIVQTFKVGMDYIDPSYLTAVSGRPCRNLDSFTLNPQQIRDIFSYGCRGADIALVEGVRGLYEGAEALDDTGSTAAIAKALDLPVVLVVSAQSITRSAAAIVKGFQAFDPDVNIVGVILNNIKGGSHKAKALTAIEHYCGVPVIGAIPRMEEMQLAMRHLGLVPYREGSGRGDFDDRIATITSIIGEYVDVDRLRGLMKEIGTHAGKPAPTPAPTLFDNCPRPDVKIGVALDEAFNFYYADLFDILRLHGAEYIPFSPVHDRLPGCGRVHHRRGIPGTVREGARSERCDAGRDPRAVSERQTHLRRMRGAHVSHRPDGSPEGMAGSRTGPVLGNVRCVYRARPGCRRTGS